jgi:hypothetical protein
MNPKPKVRKTKVKIKHIDGATIVSALPIIKSDAVEFNYRFGGMSYSQTLTVTQCISIGYIKKVRAKGNFRNMKKGNTYLISGFSYLNGNPIGASDGDMIVNIGILETHVSNFEAAF